MDKIIGDFIGQRFWIITKSFTIFGTQLHYIPVFNYQYDSVTLHMTLFCFPVSLILEHVFSEIKIYLHNLHPDQSQLLCSNITHTYTLTHTCTHSCNKYTNTNHLNPVPKLAKKSKTNKIWYNFRKE